jgi:hypothetical protein
MSRALLLSVALLVCFALTACYRPVGDGKTHGAKAELAKTQAELERLKAELAKAKGGMGGEDKGDATRAELAKAQGEIERLKGELAEVKGATGGEPKAPPTPSKKCLSNGGAAVFPDGTTEPFTEMKGRKVLGTTSFEVSHGTQDEIHFATMDGKPRWVSLQELASLSFGKYTKGATLSEGRTDVEVTTVDGLKEKLVAKDTLMFVVKWKNKIGT